MLKIGIIGCGKVSRKHVAALSLLQEENLAQLVAASDQDEDGLNQLTTTTNVKGYAHHKHMLESENLDAVIVATPSGSHAEIGLDVLNHGVHTILEKPLTLKLEDADRLIELASQKNVGLFEIKQNRFNVAIQKTKEAIQKGRLGQITTAAAHVLWHRDQAYYDSAAWRGTWAMDGGVFANQAIHHLDLLVWLIGPVESVMAKGATLLHNIEAEDTGVALIKFVNGALVVVQASVCINPKDQEGSIDLYGVNGTVRIGGFSADQIKAWQFIKEDDQDKTIQKNGLKNPENQFAYAHTENLRNIFLAIQAKKPAIIDGHEARKTLELISAIYESMESGREVYLAFKPRHSRLGG